MKSGERVGTWMPLNCMCISLNTFAVSQLSLKKEIKRKRKLMDKNKKEDIRQRVGGESILNNRCIDR